MSSQQLELPSQNHCDICGKYLSHRFIDGKTIHTVWATMCIECHRQYGKGLGIGLGQTFIRLPDGNWIKDNGKQTKGKAK